MPGNHVYPLFSPPDSLAGRNPREWSDAEAERYRVWIETVLDSRTNHLLSVVGEKVEDVSLRRVGAAVAKLLNTAEFSTHANGARTLTNEGYALAADVGLLVARLLLAACPATVKWTVVKRPKSDISYHLPVLIGESNLVLEPVGGSIAEAHAVLRGVRTPEIWQDMFDHWRRQLCI